MCFNQLLFYREKSTKCSFWFKIHHLEGFPFQFYNSGTQTGFPSVDTSTFDWVQRNRCSFVARFLQLHHHTDTEREREAEGRDEWVVENPNARELNVLLSWRGIWSCWEGEASWTQPDINPSLTWSDFFFFFFQNSCSQKDAIWEGGCPGSREAGERLSSLPNQRAALPFERFQKTNWLGSTARQLADGEVRCIWPTWAFSS